MYNIYKYTSQYIGYNKIDTSRMAVYSININNKLFIEDNCPYT